MTNATIGICASCKREHNEPNERLCIDCFSDKINRLCAEITRVGNEEPEKLDATFLSGMAELGEKPEDTRAFMKSL